MDRTEYNIRNYDDNDEKEILRLCSAACGENPPEDCLSPCDAREKLHSPAANARRDVFIATAQEATAGFLILVPEPAIKRVVFYGLVHPEHRRRGLGRRLLARGLRRAGELGAAVSHINIARSNIAAKILLRKAGFYTVRRFLEMALDLGRLPAVSKAGADRHCIPLLPGQEAALTRLQNDCFAGTWGFQPNTVEEIAYRWRRECCSPREITVWWEKEQPAGYCWNVIAPAEGAARVLMLGVAPRFRGQGLGRQILGHALETLRRRGLRRVVLTVDAANRTAYRLYLSMGFKPFKVTRWYEKPILQD